MTLFTGRPGPKWVSKSSTNHIRKCQIPDTCGLLRLLQAPMIFLHTVKLTWMPKLQLSTKKTTIETTVFRCHKKFCFFFTSSIPLFPVHVPHNDHQMSSPFIDPPSRFVDDHKLVDTIFNHYDNHY